MGPRPLERRVSEVRLHQRLSHRGDGAVAAGDLIGLIAIIITILSPCTRYPFNFYVKNLEKD